VISEQAKHGKAQSDELYNVKAELNKLKKDLQDTSETDQQH